jgi:hypothetical protein
MQIGEKYQITADKYNVIVMVKRHSEKNNSDIWDNDAYFSSVPAALKYLVDQEVLYTELKDLKTVVEAINTVKNDILKAVNGKNLL